MNGLYWAWIFLGTGLVAMVARRGFKAALRQADPVLQARMDQAGLANAGGPRFLWWLMSCGYLRLPDRRLAVLGAVQHLWLILLICLIAWWMVVMR